MTRRKTSRYAVRSSGSSSQVLTEVPQKPKLKVGKARPKPTNFTDTSFKSKGRPQVRIFVVYVTRLNLLIGIVLNQQSLSTAAPSTTAQFSHHLSLLTSRSDSQRRDSLSYLTSAIATRPVSTPLQQPVSVILPKLLPLILDGSNGVRAQLLKLFRTLPPDDVDEHLDQLLLYLRAGITHLAADIRSSALDILGWALEIGGQQLVACAGGWVKTLKCLLAMLGWPIEASAAAWSSNKASFGKAGTEGKALVKALNSLAAILTAGLLPPKEDDVKSMEAVGFPLWHVEQHLLPKRTNSLSHLNLFGAPRDEESEVYEDREDRKRIFHPIFQQAIQKGLENAKGEGGEVGRAAAGVRKVVVEGMEDHEETFLS